MTNGKQDLPGDKPRLLFVDDEEAIRKTLPAILEQHGFEVEVAAAVPEALEIINHQKFDILLTDLNIGTAADGFILVSAMRRCQHFPYIDRECDGKEDRARKSPALMCLIDPQVSRGLSNVFDRPFRQRIAPD